MRFFRKKQERSGDADKLAIGGFLDDESELLSEALLDREWGAARRILAAADKEHFMYYVQVAAATRGVEEWIDGPIRAQPDDPLPLLIGGARAIYWAGEARGDGRASTVPKDAWPVWFQRLELAENLLDQALDRHPALAEAWHYKISLSRNRQLPAEERWRRFDRLIEIDPSHLFGHLTMLDSLLPKWGGSWDEAFRFARERTAACPATNVPLLIMKVHRNFRWESENGETRYYQRPDVASETYDAAEQSVWHDDYETTTLTPILWNHFAFALTYGRYFRQACTLYDAIGSDFIRKEPWQTVERYRNMRDWAHEEAADPHYHDE
ncbi:hypothetical protein [Micromonospora sp. NPDC004551]|uniref:hypothetical protein n=1 Tax=Micromonospora sp. NPDC004551 TaxID=3154284 RepID=UPI0033B74426